MDLILRKYKYNDNYNYQVACKISDREYQGAVLFDDGFISFWIAEDIESVEIGTWEVTEQEFVLSLMDKPWRCRLYKRVAFSKIINAIVDRFKLKIKYI